MEVVVGLYYERGEACRGSDCHRGDSGTNAAKRHVPMQGARAFIYVQTYIINFDNFELFATRKL